MIDVDTQFLSEDHRMLRDQLSRFVTEKVMPHADAWEAAGTLPRDIYTDLGDLGLLGIAVPEAAGGAGFDALGLVISGQELARSGIGGFASAVTDHADIAAPMIARNGTPDQWRRFLPDILSGRKICGLAVTEPRGGSDLTRMNTKARREGDHWVLNGQKTYITNAISGDIFVTVAKTDPDQPGARGYSLFVVEKGAPGLSVGAPFDKTGFACADMSTLFFEDFRVPADNLLGEEGRGFYLMMNGLEDERLNVGAQCLGSAERALAITIPYLKQRQAYGGSLWDLQAIRHDIARATCEVAQSKLLLYSAAAKKSRGEDARFDCTIIKASVPEMLKRVVDICVQHHGAYGYMRGTEIERIWRDTRPNSIGGGATAVMLGEVAKLL